jgi:rRNA-processing protein FCF1
MEIIFIDTNIFLHFENFEQIDWLKVCNSDSCKLVISPIVIDELDKHKIANNKVGKKARKVLNKIEELLANNESAINNGVLVEVLNVKPNKTIYEEHDLNFEEQDHRLFASMILYQKTNSNHNISICTDDIGPRIRAKQYGFSSIKLDDKYRLPYEASEIEKKIKTLEQENILLKNKIPKLHLSFNNNKDLLKLKIPIEEFTKEEFITKNLHKLEIEVPPMEIDKREPQFNTSLLSLMKPTQEQVDNYNDEREKYLNKYKTYLDSLYNYKEMINCSFDIEFYLINSGTVPAEDIDIHIHFPDGFELVEKDEFPEEPEKPKRPVMAKSKYDLTSFHIPIPNTLLYPNINPVSNPKRIDELNCKPSIRKTNSYDVDFSRKGLKHNYQNRLNTLVVIFKNRQDIKNFSVDYIVSAANIPIPYKGKLNIIFE